MVQWNVAQSTKTFNKTHANHSTFKICSEHSNATSPRPGYQPLDWSKSLIRVPALPNIHPLPRDLYSCFWTILSNCLSLKSITLRTLGKGSLSVTRYHGQVTNLWQLAVACSPSDGCHVAASIPVVTLHFHLPHIPPSYEKLRGRKRNSRMMKTRAQYTHEFHGVSCRSKSTTVKIKIHKTH